MDREEPSSRPTLGSRGERGDWLTGRLGVEVGGSQVSHMSGAAVGSVSRALSWRAEGLTGRSERVDQRPRPERVPGPWRNELRLCGRRGANSAAATRREQAAEAEDRHRAGGRDGLPTVDEEPHAVARDGSGQELRLTAEREVAKRPTQREVVVGVRHPVVERVRARHGDEAAPVVELDVGVLEAPAGDAPHVGADVKADQGVANGKDRRLGHRHCEAGVVVVRVNVERDRAGRVVPDHFPRTLQTTGSIVRSPPAVAGVTALKVALAGRREACLLVAEVERSNGVECRSRSRGTGEGRRRQRE